jgi:hypothetical protein
MKKTRTVPVRPLVKDFEAAWLARHSQRDALMRSKTVTLLEVEQELHREQFYRSGKLVGLDVDAVRRVMDRLAGPELAGRIKQ